MENNGAESFPLDDAGIETVAELDQKMREVEAVRGNIIAATNAVLTYFVRQHKLAGDWKLAANRRELVKEAAPVPAIPAAAPE